MKKLIILATGHLTDVLDSDKKEMILKNGRLNGACTVILDAYLWADSRTSSSKQNTLFCHMVSEAEGDVILIAPDADKIDKRLRDVAVILRLRKYEWPQGV